MDWVPRAFTTVPKWAVSPRREVTMAPGAGAVGLTQSRIGMKAEYVAIVSNQLGMGKAAWHGDMVVVDPVGERHSVWDAIGLKWRRIGS